MEYQPSFTPSSRVGNKKRLRAVFFHSNSQEFSLKYQASQLYTPAMLKQANDMKRPTTNAQ